MTTFTTLPDKPNQELNMTSINMSCDDVLAKDMNEKLPNRNHVLSIVGKSGSGKTNALINLLSRGKVNGVRQGYKKVFENIIIVSGTLASLKNNIFDELPDEQKIKELDQESLEFIEEFCEDKSQLDPPENTLVILDDVGSVLKSRERQITFLIQKFRHLRTSFWIVAQKFRDLPTSLRANLGYLLLFRCTNMMEMEAVYQELIPIPRKILIPFIKWVYDKKYQPLFIDCSLSKEPMFIFYKGFKRISFENIKDETACI